MNYLNDDIKEARRKLLGAVGKLNKALDYTGYKNEQTDKYVPLSINEFSPDELVAIVKLMQEAAFLAKEGGTLATEIDRTLSAMNIWHP